MNRRKKFKGSILACTLEQDYSKTGPPMCVLATNSLMQPRWLLENWFSFEQNANAWAVFSESPLGNLLPYIGAKEIFRTRNSIRSHLSAIMGLRVLALACLVGAAFAGPVQRQSESQCAKECKYPPHPKFRYESGKCYVYDFDSANGILLTATQKQNASLQATVEFQFQTLCDVIMKIKNIRIQQKVSQDEKDDLKRKLELPLACDFFDGTFRHVCPSSEESSQSLNIKKAMFSLFINQMPSLEKSIKIVEKDSFGKCLTNYTVQNNGEKVITKVKDMTSCSNKKIFLNFMKKELVSVPVIEENQMKCTQHIQNGIIKIAQCQDNHKLKSPLKNGNSWIEFSGKMSMRHIETKPAEKHSWQEPFNREEISYNIEEPRQGDRNLKEVERVLKSICPKNKLVIDMTIGKDYIKLVSLVKSLSYNELDKIYESLKDGSLCSSKKVRDIFADTLPIVATDPAIKLMVKILLNGDATGLKSKYWPATLALKQNPTKDTVAAILPLLERSCQSTSTLIGVTSLIYRLCSSEDCGKIAAVREVIKIYKKYLGPRCSSDNEKEILTSLRAFGNMGQHGEAHESIIACAKDHSKSKRIRLAAIASFRRMHTKRPQEFLQMYSNKNEDTEVRIALFRTILEHPDEKQLKQIKRVAELETNKQVSGYVCTYIENMNKTQSPRHLQIKGMLQDIEINPPKVDYLTNSKYIEFSVHNKALHVGGSVETDIIHGKKTTIPVSMRNSMYANLFGKDLNLFEWGVNTEGLEDLLQKIMALKDKIPKFETIRDRIAQKPTFEEFKDEFNYLSPNKVFGDTRAELSMYFRMLETEILGLSTSDLSGMKEMLKVAEIMSKLAHGEKADFSHSVVLVNSKLVIPSVTGRSYSIDLVGSSTVGVTAETKADFLKLPRNADVHFHFQPSVNVEFSTTVGIVSTTHRPDVRLVSRFHLESDVEARFQVKEGRAALVSLTLPSKNIALLNMSTGAFEIDEDSNEKPIFEKMQKKIDYCFTHFHKPLGVTACATVEVPKPFVTKTFPYVLPFGNGAIALKKSDNSFKSYEFRLEIPKQAGPSMKYRASFDTPGSKISRRFAADLEVKQEERHQKHLLIELVSPFKTVGGSCSFTKNDKLIKGSMELHESKTQIASASFTSNITVSRSRKMYEFKGAYFIRNHEPASIDGTVTVLTGRKEHVSIYFKTNKSQSEPISLKATIMKEGRIEFSQKSEWKLSSDVSLKSPIGDLKLRKTVEKRFKQSQSISASVGLDYQLKGKKKHSITISGTSQRSSNKVNTDVKVQSTQYPRGNMHLTWDMQRESLESLTNDVKLTDGQKPYKTYFYLKQKSRTPKTGPGHCSAIIEIPQRDIHYELSVTHYINISEQRRINIEADLCYKQDKHIKGIIDVKYESLSPLKAAGKLELEYPNHHVIYEDEVEERNGVIKGKSKLQYQKGSKPFKTFQLHYNYKILSNDSKFHHEIESSIQTPSLRSPINGKASIELNSESLAIAGQVGPQYSVQAHLKDNGVGHIDIKLPMIEGIIKTTEEDKKKTVDVDVKVKNRKPRHIIGSVTVESGDKKKFEIRIQPDVDHSPEKKILISTTVEKTSRDLKDNFVSASIVQILDIIKLSLSEEGEVSPLGDYECSFEALIKNQEPIAVRYKRKTGDEHGKTTIEVTKNNNKKAEIELDAKLNEKELSIEASITSPDHSFEDVHVYMKNQVTHSGSSKTVQTSLSCKKKDKVYKIEWNSDIQPNGLEVKAQIQTPHKNYEKNTVGFSIQVLDKTVSSSVSIHCLDKEISIQTEFKAKNHACSFVGKLSTPFEIAKEAQLQVTLDNHRSKKSVEAYIDVNNARICDIRGNLKKSSREAQIEGSVKVSNLPKVKFQGIDVKLQRAPSYCLVSGSIQLLNNKEISLVSEIKEEGSVIHTTTTIATPYKNLKDAKAHLSIEIKPSKRSILCYLDANGERKGDAELSIALSQNCEVKGRLKTVRTPEISAHVKCEKTGESFSLSANVMKGTSPLLSTSFNKLSYHGGEKLLMKTKSFEDTLLDLEISKDVSGKNSNKYSLKLKGPFSPVSITFSKNHNDENSVSTELRACREVQPSAVCYSLKCYHKNLINSGDYRFYQKVTVDLEKSVGGSFSKPVGRVHVLTTAAENDYRSKVILEVNEKKLGYESKLHLRQHENDRCSLDSHIYLPQRTSRVRVSILHNHHRVNLEADAIPNTDDPTRKLSLEVKKEINPGNKEVSGYIKVNHPRMSQPLLLTCKLQLVGEYFVKGKLVLHSGPVWGKTLIVEILPNIEQEAYGIRSMEYKIYTDDKSFDTYLKLIRQSSKREEKIGYEWKWVRHGDEKKGGLIFILSQNKSLKILYSSPSVDYEVQGSVAQGLDDINVSVASSGRKLKEIRISVSDSCASVVVTKSGPLFKSQICFNKREGSALQLLKIDVQYRQHKCLDIRVGVDPEKPEYIDVVFKRSKEKSCRPLKELIHYLKSLLQVHSLQELKRDVLEKVRQYRQVILKKVRQHRQEVLKKVEQFKHDLVEPHLRKVRKSIQDLKSKLQQHEKLVQEYVTKLKKAKEDILKRIKSAIPSSVKEFCQKFYQDYHKVAIRYYKKVLRYWPPICEIGWYCNDIKSVFRRYDVKEVKTQINRKISQIKQYVKVRLSRFRIIWPSDVINFIRNIVHEFQRRIIHTFGRLIGHTIMHQLRKYVEKIETAIRHKAIDIIDEIIKKFHHMLSKDEDLRTAQDLILIAKDKIVKAWRNKEEIAKTSARRMESNIKQKFKKIWDKEVQVVKYEPDEGVFIFKVRQPLSKDELEIVKQECGVIVRTLLQYLNR
ncbi:Vitellogenin [Araneus ventricosus]|uniref:Vitellogenin n=1 Tax=Araneus ventricosus TaxID=182803 RepID=A0A4Y2CNC1_ARAVE|nr:Vitellogenin [Araneus ventricosus]